MEQNKNKFGICSKCSSRKITIRKNDKDMFWTDICGECGHRRRRINLP